MGNKIRIKQIDLQGIFSASSQVDILSASNYASFVTQLDTTMSSDSELAAVSSSISQSIYTINQVIGSGLVSGSSQLTSSYDSRYILSGSITQTTWDNIDGKPSGLVSQSTDLSSLNTFTESIDSRVDSLEAVTSSYLTSLDGAISGAGQISDLGFVTGSYTTINSFNSLTQSFNSISQSFNVISGSVGTIDFSTLATTGSNTFIGNQTVTGSLNVSGGLIVKNTDYSWSFNSDNTTTFPNDIIDGGLNKVEIKSSNYVEMHYAEEDGVWQNFTATNKEAWVFVDPDGAAIQVLRGNDGNGGPEWNHTWRFNKDGAIVFPDSTTQTTAFTGLNQDIVSSSQQITALGFISSSTTIPAGTISGSSQLTSSFDTRYTLSGSISAVPSGTISGSSQLTSSYDARYTLSSSFSSISSSFNSRFNGLVTTGSNTFSGSQIFSGSMVVTSGQIIASTITNNSSSLFLQSGSNLYVQNNGLVEITGSLNATSITGSIAATNGVISGSTQLTTAFPSKTTGAWSVPAGASTQSFTVEAGASYTMWVNGNIPNGIITWNATVTTSNTNVPVIGAQYGWYYTAGNALVLTAMPDQIIGTTNTLISSPTSYAPNTSNVFKFGITNNSGTTQTINYGYIKLS
jgi:hypothetical protein